MIRPFFAICIGFAFLAACETGPPGEANGNGTAPGGSGFVQPQSKLSGEKPEDVGYVKPRYYKKALRGDSEWGESLEVKIENRKDVTALIHTTGTPKRVVAYQFELGDGHLQRVVQRTFFLYDGHGNLLKKPVPEPGVTYVFDKEGKLKRTIGNNPAWQPEGVDFTAEAERLLAYYGKRRTEFREVLR